MTRWTRCYVAWRADTAHELARSWHERYPDHEYRVVPIPPTPAQERCNLTLSAGEPRYRTGYAVEVR